jgi:molybdopterin converting factor small subunit
MHFRDASSSTTTLRVTVRPFGRYAEILGFEEATLELGDSATVTDAVELLRKNAPSGHMLPARPLVAIDLRQVEADRALCDGDALALLPPLAGG